MSDSVKKNPSMEEALASRPSPQAKAQMDKIMEDSLEENALMEHCKTEEEKNLDVPPQTQPMGYVPPMTTSKESPSITIPSPPVSTELPQPESIQTSSEELPAIPKQGINHWIDENGLEDGRPVEDNIEPVIGDVVFDTGLEEKIPILTPEEMNSLDAMLEKDEGFATVGVNADGAANGAPMPEIPKVATPPAEVDPDLKALVEYIREDGFVVSVVAMNIQVICAQPIVSPTTTTWDLPGSLEIPTFVFKLLTTEGYVESIWPSLKIMMGLSSANAAWASGVACTIAFFDVVKTLPHLKDR